MNFLSAEYDLNCWKTVQNNSDDIDEIIAAELTPETAKEVSALRIKEAFLTFECRLASTTDLSGKGISAMIFGQVVNAAIEESHKDRDN